MKLAVVTDEISQDPGTAVELGREWGVEWFEVRTLWGGRVPDMQPGVIDRLEAALKTFGARVSAVSPGFFKVPVDDERVGPALDDAFPRALTLTCRLGADRMVLFGFLRPESADRADEPPREVVELLGQMAERSAAQGVLCVLENEAVCWGDTGLRAAELVRRVGHENLKLNWDPGNSVTAGSPAPYPDEYRELRDLVAHVHVKDAAWREGKLVTVAPGEGIIDWLGQLRALQADGYEGFVTVETHFGPKVSASRRCVQRVRNMLEQGVAGNER